MVLPIVLLRFLFLGKAATTTWTAEPVTSRLYLSPVMPPKELTTAKLPPLAIWLVLHPWVTQPGSMAPALPAQCLA